MVAPYFVSYSVFGKQRIFTGEARERFLNKDGSAEPSRKVKVAHFTDTLYEVNGVARTLQQQINQAIRTDKDLTVITCDAEKRPKKRGVQNFKPVGIFQMPEYPQQKLFYPPFLDMLEYCYGQRFSHIHSATPGPIGLAALAIARILKLPVHGTYHTALPQYAQHLTNDSAIEELMWKFTLWYFEQMDLISVPSRSTGAELTSKGVPHEKIQLFPRGIGTELFHPSKSNGYLQEHYGIGGVMLLYVGRVSKEKNLPVLENVFKRLIRVAGAKAHLIVVGDGPYLERMRKNMLGTDCHFTGYLEGEELASVYASCDLFVFPSSTDTFGNVVLEAQACGIPVIVTDSGGPQENMIPGKTGLVVKGNNEDELLGAVYSLLSDTRRLREMGKTARQYMKDRSFERAFNETWQFYSHQERSTAPNGYTLAEAV